MDDYKSFDEWAEDLCKLTDELAGEKFTPGTPEYELQQGLMRNAKRYRDSKKCVNGTT